jgi:hypothetical protein
MVIMVNDHVGPKGNRLKVWESPSGHHLPEKRLHGLEEADWSDIRKSAIGRNESRDAGVADKHYLSVVIKSRRGIKENSLSILETLFEKGTARF